MQSSQYVNHLMENTNTSQTKSSKKKLRFFSKSSKKRESNNPLEYQNYNQCYCEECMRTVVNHRNDYTIRSQQMANPYSYPNETQLVKQQSLALDGLQQQRSSVPEEHTYMEVPDPYVERIYPPPQQFPCECHNCAKKRVPELTTELLPLDTYIPLQMMPDSAVLCNIL